MVIFEIPFWKKWGISELVEWQLNRVIVSKEMGNRNPRVPWIVAGHLFHGAIAGFVLSLLLPLTVGISFSRAPVLFDSLVYSLILWLMFSFAPRTLYEKKLGFRSSGRGLVIALSSHVVYGISLGLLLSLI